MEFNAKCPTGWADRSMLVYAMAPPTPTSGVVPNVVITRDRFEPFLPVGLPERLRSFVDIQVEEIKKRLREPQLHKRWTSRFKELDVEQIRLSWLSDITRVTQWVVFIAVTSEHVIIATASSAESEFERYKPQFLEAFGSIDPGS